MNDSRHPPSTITLRWHSDKRTVLELSTNDQWSHWLVTGISAGTNIHSRFIGDDISVSYGITTPSAKDGKS